MIKDPRHLRESVDDAIRSSVNYALTEEEYEDFFG